jgi:hypothetical protein
MRWLPSEHCGVPRQGFDTVLRGFFRNPRKTVSNPCEKARIPRQKSPIPVAASHSVRSVLTRATFLTDFLSTVFGVVNVLSATYAGPTWACGFAIWLLQVKPFRTIRNPPVDLINYKLTTLMSSFLIFSIVLNMQLVIVHGFNGQRMEKYYVTASAIISLSLTVPAYISKQYGCAEVIYCKEFHL